MQSVRIVPGVSFLSLMLLATACGCGAVPLSKESREAIRTVAVARDVEEAADFSGKLPGMDHETRSTVWFSSVLTAPVGIVYELADWSENKRRRESGITKRLEEAGLDVSGIVRSQFSRQLAARRIFDSIHGNPPQAVFRLRVEHGLADGLGLRGGWRPWMAVEGVLEDEEGRVLWRSEASIDDSDARLPELNDPFRQTELLERAYVLAARLVTAQLVEDLEG